MTLALSMCYNIYRKSKRGIGATRRKFEIGEYVLFKGRIYIVVDYFDDMMFGRGIDDGLLEVLLEREVDYEVKRY